jgi:hypothetical protein
LAKVKRSAFSQFKDAALEQALLLFLRPRFERYGEISNLTLDTSQKVLTAEVRLRGESMPLQVHEAHYRTEQADGETRVIIYDVKVSREWAQHLLEDHFREISIKIPPLLQALVH